MILEQGKSYQATIKLGFFEQVADNETIRAKLIEAGLQNVSVSGRGSTRAAVATWNAPTKEVQLPSQVRNVKQL